MSRDYPTDADLIAAYDLAVEQDTPYLRISTFHSLMDGYLGEYSFSGIGWMLATGIIKRKETP